jgi:hypothetical protein
MSADVAPGPPPPAAVSRPTRPAPPRAVPLRAPGVATAVPATRPAHRATHRRDGRGVLAMVVIMAGLVLLGLAGAVFALGR